MRTEKDSILATSLWNAAEIKANDFCRTSHFKVYMYFFDGYQYLTYHSVVVIVMST
jgi:hypothetical protein